MALQGVPLLPATTRPTELQNWLIGRLANVIQPDAVRYETSMYGVFNEYWVTKFPNARGFMTKPQARIRAEYNVREY